MSRSNFYLSTLAATALGLVACQPSPITGIDVGGVEQPSLQRVHAVECNLIPNSTSGYGGGLWVPKDAAGRRIDGQIYLHLSPQSYTLNENTVLRFFVWRVNAQGQKEWHNQPLPFELLNFQSQQASEMVDELSLSLFSDVAPDTQPAAVLDRYVLRFRSIGLDWKVFSIAYYQNVNIPRPAAEDEEEEADEAPGNAGANAGEAEDEEEASQSVTQASASEPSATTSVQASHYDDILLPPFAAQFYQYQTRNTSPMLLNLHPLRSANCPAQHTQCWQQAANNLCVHRPSVSWVQHKPRRGVGRLPASVGGESNGDKLNEGGPKKVAPSSLWGRVKAFMLKIVSWFK